MSAAGSGGGDPAAARRAALKMLERRALSRAELRQKLIGKGHDVDVVDGVVAALAGERHVDDRALAESVVRLELRRMPAGTRLLEAKLARRGIGEALAREVVAEAVRAREGDADAEVVARRKLRGLPSGLAVEVKRRRLLGVLSRRGFTGEEARGAVERVLGAESGDDGGAW